MNDMEDMAEELIRLRGTDLTEQELVEAASSPLEVVRAAVARHPDTPKDILLELVDDDVLEVVIAVAHNVNPYREVTQALLNLDDDGIREHVLTCSAPTSVHFAVAATGSYDDVYRILENRHVGTRTLNRIHDRAVKEEFGVCRDDEVLRMLITHPHTEEEVREDIFKTGNPALMVFFARCEYTPTHILQALLSHSDPMVRLLTGLNPSLPLHLQDQFHAETGVEPILFRAVMDMDD